MKKIIAIIYLSFFSVACNTDVKKTDELIDILNNISTSSYFIAIDVKCGEETFTITITNNIFYLMLKDEKLLKNDDHYSSMMIKKIINNEAITFNKSNKEILDGYSVIKNDSLEIFLKTNKDAFLNKYFENSRFKSEEFSFDQAKAIIYYLFKKGIYCRRDCNSGYVFIDSKTNNN
jgi:hypothetical protein